MHYQGSVFCSKCLLQPPMYPMSVSAGAQFVGGGAPTTTGEPTSRWMDSSMSFYGIDMNYDVVNTTGPSAHIVRAEVPCTLGPEA
jgi:hypothetical protein